MPKSDFVKSKLRTHISFALNSFSANIWDEGHGSKFDISSLHLLLCLQLPLFQLLH
jgi:hypothetical protein